MRRLDAYINLTHNKGEQLLLKCIQAEEAWRAKQAAEVMSRRAARTIQKSWHAYKVKVDAETKKAAAAEKKKGKGAAKGKKK